MTSVGCPDDLATPYLPGTGRTVASLCRCKFKASPGQLLNDVEKTLTECRESDHISPWNYPEEMLRGQEEKKKKRLVLSFSCPLSPG
jgi:hypothetical protein